jgi:FkbM family methyltransferase
MIKNYTIVLLAIITKIKNWPQVLFAKIFDRKIENIVLRNGLNIHVDDKIGKADLSMFSEIFYKQYYNPEGLEINNGDIVFDIGANNGFFSYFASQKNKTGKIYTFEPLPVLADKIKKTVEINNIKNIILENFAVGNDAVNPIKFYVSNTHNGCHSLYSRDNTNTMIDVNIINLKKYCNLKNINKIDFLKLDCEGAEYEIMTQEDMEFIKNTVSKISMEYHDDINDHKHEEIVDLLIKNDFRVSVKDGYIYAINSRNH